MRLLRPPARRLFASILSAANAAVRDGVAAKLRIGDACLDRPGPGAVCDDDAAEPLLEMRLRGASILRRARDLLTDAIRCSDLVIRAEHRHAVVRDPLYGLSGNGAHRPRLRQLQRWRRIGSEQPRYEETRWKAEGDRGEQRSEHPACFIAEVPGDVCPTLLGSHRRLIPALGCYLRGLLGPDMQTTPGRACNERGDRNHRDPGSGENNDLKPGRQDVAVRSREDDDHDEAYAGGDDQRCDGCQEGQKCFDGVIYLFWTDDLTGWRTCQARVR